MNWRNILPIIFCVLIVLAGCSSQSPDSTAINTTSTVVTPKSETHPTSKTQPSSTPFPSPSSTLTQSTVSSEEWNSSRDYTNQFRQLLQNDSLSVSDLNNPYNGGEYDTTDLQIDRTSIVQSNIGDHNSIYITQTIGSAESNHLRRSVGRIGIIFGTILKREASNDEGDWNVSEVIIRTRVDEQVVAKNRIEWYWANNWVFTLLSWDTETYIEERIGATTSPYRNGTFRDSAVNVRTLEQQSEVEAIDSNITQIEVNKSGPILFATYVTETPPTEDHAAERIEEIKTIISEYGELSRRTKSNRYNYTTIFIEEVYKSGDRYDTRRTYGVRSPFSERVAAGEVPPAEIADYLLGNVTIEGDEYYE